MYRCSLHHSIPVLQAYDTVDQTLQRNIINYFDDVNLRDLIDLFQSQVCTPARCCSPH